MSVRKVFLQGAWYYLLLSTTASVFLFVTTLNSVFDGSAGFQSPWLNNSNKVTALFWSVMLADQLIGLFVLILLRRMAYSLSKVYFAFLYGMLFIFFIMPSLVSILAAVILSGSV